MDLEAAPSPMCTSVHHCMCLDQLPVAKATNPTDSWVRNTDLQVLLLKPNAG